MRHTILAHGAIALLLSATATDARAQNTIGSLIRAAVTTALPGATPLVEALWPKNTDGSAATGVNKDKMTQSVQNSGGVAKVQDAVTANAQEKLKPLVDLASELAVLTRFLQPSVNAMEHLSSIQARVAGGANATAADWAEVATRWAQAKAELAAVDGITSANLGIVRDLWLRNTLSRIQAAKIRQVIPLDNQIAAKDAARVSQSVQALMVTLQDVSPAVGYELADLQSDISSLSAWARGAAGGPIVQNAAQRAFKTRLSARYP